MPGPSRLIDFLCSVVSRDLSMGGVRADALRSVYDAAARKREVFARRHGFDPPSILFLSATTRCPSACIQCSAAGFAPDVDLAPELIDRVLGEVRDLGTFYVALTGGEPLLHPGFAEIVDRHRDFIFLLFTSGRPLDLGVADFLADRPHVMPFVSIEGQEAQTDRVRGPGAFVTAAAAMERLRERAMLFGFCATATREALPDLESEEFYTDMHRRGCQAGILLDYLPVGRDPNPARCLRFEERKRLADRLDAVRRDLGLFLAYVPLDESHDGAGRCHSASDLLHVTAEGYVEPCPFLRFAANNVRDTSIEQALLSRFFSEMRNRAGVPNRASSIPCYHLQRSRLLAETAKETGAASTVRSAE